MSDDCTLYRGSSPWDVWVLNNASGSSSMLTYSLVKRFACSVLLLRVESMCFNRLLSMVVGACYGHAAHTIILTKIGKKRKTTRIILEHLSQVMDKCKKSTFLNIYDKQQQVEEDIWHFCDINSRLESVIIYVKLQLYRLYWVWWSSKNQICSPCCWDHFVRSHFLVDIITAVLPHHYNMD